jgi:hypothetical protein
MDDWVTLKVGNDWGVEYLNEVVCDERGYSNYSRFALRFRSGDALRVRWPDGFESTERIVVRTIVGSVSDHGKRYSTDSPLPFIECSVHGVGGVFIALQDLQVARESLQPIIARMEQ